MKYKKKKILLFIYIVFSNFYEIEIRDYCIVSYYPYYLLCFSMLKDYRILLILKSFLKFCEQKFYNTSKQNTLDVLYFFNIKIIIFQDCFFLRYQNTFKNFVLSPQFDR